ncbi:hypothetical protein K439DRAFT_1657168 [Ramaria rubella]|nr:hypothetical protein K439DRAFT_1657168 [Ramaria rubella]
MIIDYSELSLTGYVPTTSEYSDIQVAVEEQQRELASVDEEIANLRAYRIKLWRSCTSSSGLVAPIRRLPHEVLGDIFAYSIPGIHLKAMELGAHPFRRHGHPDDARATLLRVCRHWSAVMIDTPKVWTTIDLHCHEKQDIERVKQMFRRSKSCPIEVYLKLESEADFDPIEPVFLENISRLWSLYVNIIYVGFLPLGNDIEMPNLNYEMADQTIRTPKLYFLRIVGNTASFANACHALRRLQLKLIFHSFQNTDASDILHACPNLEFLYWQDGMDFTDHYTSETNISLPFLTELEIHSSPRSSERMLRRLVTPSLETATLQPISNRSSSAQEQTMTVNVFLELNLEKLRELTLHHHDLGAWTDTESKLGDMLDHLPSLTTLCLVHCRLHRTFFNTAPLSRPTGRPSHGLEKIHLIFTTYYASDLAEFVRAYSMPDVAAAGLKD